MKISYDKEVDAKYIFVRKGKAFETKRVRSWLIIDYDKKGRTLGIEVLDASRNFVHVHIDGENVIEIAFEEKQDWGFGDTDYLGLRLVADNKFEDISKKKIGITV